MYRHSLFFETDGQCNDAKDFLWKQLDLNEIPETYEGEEESSDLLRVQFFTEDILLGYQIAGIVNAMKPVLHVFNHEETQT